MALNLPLPSALTDLISLYTTSQTTSPPPSSNPLGTAKHASPTPRTNPSTPLKATPTPNPHLCLAVQILHNLQYQHDWTALELHTVSPLTGAPLSRPLVAGLPPHRVYVHPDEQVEFLQRERERERVRKVERGKDAGSERGNGDGGEGGDQGGEAVEEEGELAPEREWVLPTHISEPWSLRRFAEVFDAVGEMPPEIGKCNDWDVVRGNGTGVTGEVDGEERGEKVGYDVVSGQKGRRGGKRVLLATLSDDSSVSYYVVHDGIVKPRQN